MGKNASILKWSLWVAGIYYVLVILFRPSIGTGGGEHTKVQAKNDLVETITSLKGFREEYSRFPQLGSKPDQDLIIDANTQDDIFFILRALEEKSNPRKDTVQNTRKIVYFEGKAATHVPPKGGFGEDGTLYDPWGGIYRFVIDTNGDGVVRVPEEWHAADSGKTITAPVIGFSAGKTDKQKDDVTTW